MGSESNRLNRPPEAVSFAFPCLKNTKIVREPHKQSMKYKATLLMLCLFCAYCTSPSTTHSATEVPTDPYAHLTSDEVKRVLTKAMNKAGGLTNWNQIKTLKFKKDYALLFESGEVENAALQTHLYTFQPEQKVGIEWEKEGKKHKISQDGGQPTKKIDGELDPTAKQQSITNTVLSATFVISIPFKLLDEGVVLSYDGVDTLADGRKVEVLKAVYNPAQTDTHSTPDTWWHYYDADDFTFVAYMVQHADHFSYVENLSFDEVDGFVFPRERKSYRVDSERNIQYLRATYEYMDYEVVKE